MKTVKYEVMRFPDGEVQVKLTEPINHKENYELKIRITNAEELFIADQLMDILDRHEVVYRVIVTYLMGMRMDRVMDFDRPFTLKIVASVFNKHNYDVVWVYEAHSRRTYDLIKRCFVWNSNMIDKIPDIYQVLLPDSGARERYDAYCGFSAIYGNKVRDVETGKILSIDIKNPEDIKKDRIAIIDDLCDGGGTFLGLLEAVKKYKPEAKVDLYVTHMVNEEGLKKVCKAFNHVYITDSYYDWSSYCVFYKNLTVFPLNLNAYEV